MTLRSVYSLDDPLGNYDAGSLYLTYIYYNKVKAIFHTRGTCSQQIELEVDDNHIIQHVAFVGGCHGNTQGIALLVRGQKADDVIVRLEGIRCGMKPTSCPDQLARALKEAIRRIDEQKQNESHEE